MPAQHDASEQPVVTSAREPLSEAVDGPVHASALSLGGSSERLGGLVHSILVLTSRVGGRSLDEPKPLVRGAQLLLQRVLAQRRLLELRRGRGAQGTHLWGRRGAVVSTCMQRRSSAARRADRTVGKARRRGEHMHAAQVLSGAQGRSHCGEGEAPW